MDAGAIILVIEDNEQNLELVEFLLDEAGAEVRCAMDAEAARAALKEGMPDLTVEVRDRDIIVSKPSDGLSITYRKDGFAPILLAIDDMPDKPTPEELRFMPRAWRAAFEKAKSLGWLN